MLLALALLLGVFGLRITYMIAKDFVQLQKRVEQLEKAGEPPPPR